MQIEVQQNVELGEISMRVIPADNSAGAVNGAVRPHRFWQWLARILDDYLVDRTKRTVPNATVRRSRHEIDRCRRLMLKGSLTPAHSEVACVSPHRAASVMTRPPQRDSARFPVRGIAVVDGNEPKLETFRPPGTAAIVKFPPRPDPRVLSASIPLFFVGRNKYGFWVVRSAERRAGGIFLLRRSALRFAAKNSASAGCATMFLSDRFELDAESQGGVLAAALDAMIRIVAAPAPPRAPLMASRKSRHYRRAA